MNVNSNSNATTFSMIVCQLLLDHCINQDITMKKFFDNTIIKQPTWSRIVRGQSKLTLEDLRDACAMLKVDMVGIIDNADKLAKELSKKEHIEVIEPIGTTTDIAKVGKTILTLGALAFLVSRLLK